ncbi:MAG: OmpA family protein [Saprospiraceae bacterium]|nr:OmpA family protein [Saprospiraceae bacterium]
MKKVIAVLLVSVNLLQGQTKIAIANKSFEDIPRMGGGMNLPIAGWYDCGAMRFPGESAPDIHPGNFWNNTTLPSQGNTYLGMVVRDNESWEGIAQRLVAPMKAGKCYKFTIDLAKSSTYLSLSQVTKKSTNYVTPAVFRIWGGNGMCGEKELLGESAAVNHTDWRTYQFKVKPTSEHKYVLIEAFYKTPNFLPYCGHILVDNLSDFDEMDCEEVLPPVLTKQALAKLETKEALPPHKKTRVEQSKEKSKPQDSTVAAAKPKILEELDIKKIKKGTTIEIKNLYFKADTSTIDRSSYEVLDEIYGFLKNHNGVKLEIGGHTNGIPSHEYCDKLSTARAKAVYDYLMSKGIDPSRLTYKGYGKRRKIASDSTVEGRTKNQRVEVKVMSLS